jgi:hypothetical protein
VKLQLTISRIERELQLRTLPERVEGQEWYRVTREETGKTNFLRTLQDSDTRSEDWPAYAGRKLAVEVHYLPATPERTPVSACGKN